MSIKQFQTEEFPEYIQHFDYTKNIPKRARNYYQQNNEESMLMICAGMRKHVIMSGPAGSGKTELIIKYARDNKIPLFKMSCSNDIRMDDLIGSRTIDNNQIKFQAGMLLKAVLTANKHGSAIILLDEINTLAEKVQKNINGLADGTGFIDIPMGRITINDGAKFLICGTMNMSYAGTNPLNPELKDRFAIIDMPIVSKDIKHKIFSPYTLDEDLELNLIKLSDRINELQKNMKISGDVVFSTRSQISFLEVYKELEDDPIRNALNVTLVSKFNDEEDRTIIKELIEQVFFKKEVIKETSIEEHDIFTYNIPQRTPFGFSTTRRVWNSPSTLYDRVIDYDSSDDDR